jgi:hypothetical protein
MEQGIPSILIGDSTCHFWTKLEPLKYINLLYKQEHSIKPPSSHIHETLKRSETIEAKLYWSNNVSIASRSISHEHNHQSNHTVMLSDKYFRPVPELTLVHEAYELASFREPVTPPVHFEAFWGFAWNGGHGFQVGPGEGLKPCSFWSGQFFAMWPRLSHWKHLPSNLKHCTSLSVTCRLHVGLASTYVD